MSAYLVKTTVNDDGSKTFNEIKPTLSQKEEIAILRKGFEDSFGVDQESRTEAQWRNLVMRYGLDFVCQTEKMSGDQVMSKMGFAK